MHLEGLLVAQPVRLIVSLQAIISREDALTHCARCGEEIFKDREGRLGEELVS